MSTTPQEQRATVVLLLFVVCWLRAVNLAANDDDVSTIDVRSCVALAWWWYPAGRSDLTPVPSRNVEHVQRAVICTGVGPEPRIRRALNENGSTPDNHRRIVHANSCSTSTGARQVTCGGKLLPCPVLVPHGNSVDLCLPVEAAEAEKRAHDAV
eukprot:scaffold102478_cov63-Phaeocystis_antarctica.AAC.3